MEDECAICLETTNLTLTIPCHHRFCFLCLKGVLDFRCPLCRRAFDKELLDKPAIKVLPVPKSEPHWAYSSRNIREAKWWLFDDRTSAFIENKFWEPTSVMDSVLIAWPVPSLLPLLLLLHLLPLLFLLLFLFLPLHLLLLFLFLLLHPLLLQHLLLLFLFLLLHPLLPLIFLLLHLLLSFPLVPRLHDSRLIFPARGIRSTLPP